MISANELNARLDDQLRDDLDTYAERFFKKPNNRGDRSKAARHLLASIFDLERMPQVASILDGDMIINGDITILIRTAMAEYIASLDKEHELQ